MPNQLVSIKEASEWASNLLNRDITTSNISYLIQYGKVQKYSTNGSTQIDLNDLKKYYDSFNGTREIEWKEKLGSDLNWHLSFDHLREKDTTKHVHRLHPYKGKYIPQLVEYFLDSHVDEYKRQAYFKKGDIILDPFVGSGTTLVQANELGMHSIGIDISQFNCLISDIKLQKYNFDALRQDIKKIQEGIISYEIDHTVKSFEVDLNAKLNEFNRVNFPSPQIKYKFNRREINEDQYGKDKEKEFSRIYNYLIKRHNISLLQKPENSFLNKWYLANTRKEIDYIFELVKKIKDINNRKLLAVILSRTIRSCRATTHSDLATLKDPQITTYYCYKHKKICKPIFSIRNMLLKYSVDTLARVEEFNGLRSEAKSALITADSRTVNIDKVIQKRDEAFYKKLEKKRIKGIFTSPPYVGQIDYHEQHAYAYDLLGFKRRDELEIGPLYEGQGLKARNQYVEGISKVLLNCKKYLARDYDIFFVANDKYNLYPEIVKRSGMKIVNQFKRPVLNRTERDKSPYSEIIFHFKEI